MTTKTPNEICDLIYHRHQSAMQLVHDTHATLHGSIVAFSLRLALTELAAALQDSQPPAATPDRMMEQIYCWLYEHDPELASRHNTSVADDIIAYADRLRGTVERLRIELAAAGADVQLNRINDWIRTYAGDAYDPLSDDGDTADAIIAVADRLRGECEQRKIAAGQLQSQNVRITQEFQAVQITINQLRTELAAAINERRVADSLLATLADWLADKPVVGDSNVVDLAISLMTSQAAEIKRLNADLAILRSYSTATPHGNGKSHPAAILPSAQSAQSADETPAWNDTMLTGLDAATLDYWHGINAGRWTWRKLPKSVRLAMVRHVLSFTETDAAMSMSQFDAFKPHWMPGAGTHPITFGVTWSTLADLRTEIEVPA